MKEDHEDVYVKRYVEGHMREHEDDHEGGCEMGPGEHEDVNEDVFEDGCCQGHVEWSDEDGHKYLKDVEDDHEVDMK